MTNSTPEDFSSSPDHGDSSSWSGADASQTGSPEGAPPPPPGYGQAGPSYQQPSNQGGSSTDDRNKITLNFWLSAFFTWVPALIFYLIEQDKNSRAYEFHKANLNFSLLRLFIGLFAIIPFVGWIVGGIGIIVTFVIQIMAAINAPKEFDQGAPTYKYPFNIPLIK